MIGNLVGNAIGIQVQYQDRLSNLEIQEAMKLEYHRTGVTG